MTVLKGGAILTQSGKYVIDRAQTVGAGDLTIQRDKVKETGNDESVSTTTGIPEISWDLESWDASCEFEATLVGENPNTFPNTVGSNEIDFRDAIPIDVISLIKTKKNSAIISGGTILTYLYLSNATYRFGVGDNATQSFTLNGDTILHTPGQPYVEEFANSGVGPYTIAKTAELYSDSGDSVYVTSVCLYNTTTGLYKRVFFDDTGADGYTNTSTTFTLPADESASYDLIKVTYSSQTLTNYNQTGNNPSGNVIHPTASVKPGAVRSQDLNVYIGTSSATPVFSRMTGVQSVEATWSVSLDNLEELGNSHYFSSDYDVPDVSGSVSFFSRDAADLRSKLSAVTGVPTNQIIGPNSSVVVPLEMHVNHPDTGVRLKTIYVPDARFNIPGLQAQVDTNVDSTLNWTSDSGVLLVYNGQRRSE